MTPDFVFKVFRQSEWNRFEVSGVFTGSPDDHRDGFIHLSWDWQVPGTIEKHFVGEEQLVIAKISGNHSGIKMEVSRGGEQYPHLYGTLLRADVVSFEGWGKASAAITESGS